MNDFLPLEGGIEIVDLERDVGERFDRRMQRAVVRAGFEDIARIVESVERLPWAYFRLAT